MLCKAGLVWTKWKKPFKRVGEPRSPQGMWCRVSFKRVRNGGFNILYNYYVRCCKGKVSFWVPFGKAMTKTGFRSKCPGAT